MFSHATAYDSKQTATPRRLLTLWFLLIALLPVCANAVPTQWEWAHPTPHGNQHNSVIWGDSEFIAVGEGGNIITSELGTAGSWTAQSSNTTENLNDIAWNGTVYIGVGDQGTIIRRATNGQWDLRTSNVTHKLTNVIWNGSKFLAIGEYTASVADPINGTHNRPAAVILTSSAGSTWRSEAATLNPDRHSNIPPPRLRGVTWDGNLFVASSDDGAILTSTNGIAWHTRSINSITSNNLAAPDKRFLAVGDNGLVLISNDGISWTILASDLSDNLHAVTWANTESGFVIVGASGTVISTTDNGATWITEDSTTTEALRDVTFDSNSTIIAVGDNGTIITRLVSNLTWTQQTTATAEDLHSIAWRLEAIHNYVAVGTGGTILKSIADVTLWEAVTDPPIDFATDLLNVEWHDMTGSPGDEFFLATGKDGVLLTTTVNIDTWESQTSNISDEWLFDSTWDGTNHIVVGSNGTLITSTSIDGSSWTTQNAQTNEHLLSIAVDGPTIMIGGEYNTQITTSDPTSITLPDIITEGRITAQNLNDILFNNGIYIAVGNASTIIFSNDLLNWMTPTSIIGSSVTNDLLSIGVENRTGDFLATGTWGSFLRSDPTADAWVSEAIPTASPSASFFYGVASSPVNPVDTLVVTVGSGGDIFTSVNSGDDWNISAGSTESEETINDLAKSDTLHVAVGDNGTILNSTNAGVDWASQKLTSSCGDNHLHAVTWSDTTMRFVAVGDLGTICYSDDGVSWTPPPISPNLPDSTSTLYGIAWGQDQFIAVGGSSVNSVIYTSPNGEAWTPRSSSESSILRDIVWNEDHFIAIGDGGTITTSPKGISWTRNSSGTTVNLHSIAIGEDAMLIIGATTSPLSTIILQNTDGTWLGGDGTLAQPNIHMNDISFGGTQFAAVAPSGTIMISSDGAGWTEVLTGTNSLFKTILWDETKFIAAGAAAHILYANNPDLVISGDFTTETVRKGETARYVFTITNRGITTADQASYTGTLSRNSSFLSATTTRGSCSMGGDLTCQFGNLTTGETVTLAVDIVTTETGLQQHTGIVSANLTDSDEEDNSIAITLEVSRGNDDGGGAALGYWWLTAMLFFLLTCGRVTNHHLQHRRD